MEIISSSRSGHGKPQKSGQALEQAAQGSSGVTIPGGVQKTCRCGTWGHGLAGMVVLG